MGCSFSSLPSSARDDHSLRPPTVMIVSPRGSLHEYGSRVTVADAIAAEGRGSALCDSDELFFDEFPPAMPSLEELKPGQIYFLMSPTELSRRLTGADMAALAGKASTALRRAAEKHGRRMWRPRVMPAVDLGEGGDRSRLRAAGDVRKKKGTRDYKGRRAGDRSRRLRRALSAVEETNEEE
ncbi:hypothetical protein HPP92_022017 [Vanilla planifolia]|uniref:Uncharacterized protein n=1 Tax=Vanilla planifolia TaxID=51239 RepID=A0A835PWN1_VANPL|nr:hypothetical protein HPP92_022017 [Vanilla planifolia]